MTEMDNRALPVGLQYLVSFLADGRMVIGMVIELDTEGKGLKEWSVGN